MHALTLLSALSLVSLALATPDLSHRRHHRTLVERQGQGRPNMNNSWSEPPVSSSTAIISSASPSPSSQAASSSSSAVATSSVRPSQSSFIPFEPSSSSSTVEPVASSSNPPAVSSASSTAVESIALSSVAVVSSVIPSPSAGVPTISVLSSAPASLSSAAISTPSVVTRLSTQSVVTATRTASASASVSAASAQEESTSSGGLSKTALIAIIVVASVVGAAAIAFTLLRKWKLRPSNRFEKRLNAIDFAPKGGDYDDDFYEKSHNRSGSASSAERHRKALIEEEFDNAPVNHVAGIPEHDFTAGTVYGAGAAGAGAYGAYNSDPFAHAQAYDYAYGSAEHGYPPQPQGYDQYGNPLSPQGYGYDYPTQDHDGRHVQGHGVEVYAAGPADQGQGYADLQRGNSNGSAHLHGHHQPRTASPPGNVGQTYQDDFPESGMYLGRPTGGVEGPYAQAAQYRSY